MIPVDDGVEQTFRLLDVINDVDFDSFDEIPAYIFASENGTIDPRIKPEDYQKIQDFYDSGEKEKTFRFSVSLPGKEEQIPIRARIVRVGDESNNVKYILNIELVQ